MSKQYRLKLIQKRVSNIAIGASTLRSQGPAGTIKIARKFLSKLDLSKFKGISDKKFNIFLQKNTKKLMEQFQGTGKNNWGAARKSINVFLESAFYDRYLAKEYNLHSLEKLLELPLDSYVIRQLKKRDADNTLPNKFQIKTLTSEDNDTYQMLANKIANEMRTSRIFLDLEFWRGEGS